MPVLYPELDLDGLQRRMQRSGRGIVIVSAHYSLYFLLLDLADRIERPFVVLTNADGVAFWQAQRSTVPPHVEFATAPTRAHIRACRAGDCALFFMADTLVPGSIDLHVPFLGRMCRFSATWAGLAARLALDVVPAIARADDAAFRVMIDHVSGTDTGAHELAIQVLRRLEGFMTPDPDLWEHDALFADCPPLADPGCAPLADPAIAALALSDAAAFRLLTGARQPMGATVSA